MAKGLNKVMLIGNLGKNPELKYISTGNPVVEFSLATNEDYKDKNGVKQTKTEWHNIVIWGKLAEICNQYLKKGSKVYLEGKIETRSWDDKEGKKHYKTEIKCSDMSMLDGRDGGAARGGASAGGGYDDAVQPEPSDSGSFGNATPPGGGTSDDLPF